MEKNRVTGKIGQSNPMESLSVQGRLN